MLYVTNDDKPGFIGRLGTLLGDAAINIATFHLGRLERLRRGLHRCARAQSLIEAKKLEKPPVSSRAGGFFLPVASAAT
jgi:hypothetical protein